MKSYSLDIDNPHSCNENIASLVTLFINYTSTIILIVNVSYDEGCYISLLMIITKINSLNCDSTH